MKRVLAALLLFLHLAAGADTIRKSSATYDEPIHLIAGYSYWVTGRYRINIYDHPPVAEMLAAVPLLFMRPFLPTAHPGGQEYRRHTITDLFLFKNRVDAQRMLDAARMMVLVLSCLLGLLVFAWADELYGGLAGLLALFLYVLSSNCLAHGTLVTTDLAVTFSFFAAVYLLWRWVRRPRGVTLVLLSLASALTLTTKYSGAILLIVLAGILAALQARGEFDGRRRLGSALSFLALCAFFVLAVYRFAQAGLYYEGFTQTFLRTAAGHPAFLLGRHSTTGWWYYFIVAFLLKTPVPFLGLACAALVLGFRRPGRTESVFLLAPVLVYFAIASVSRKQIGLRYILPIFPFLFVWVSGLLSGASLQTLKAPARRALLGFVGIMLAWYAAAFAGAHPWHLAYFNEVAGGPANGYKRLSDSNIDWGQGLEDLARWYKRNGLQGIYLCYFGTASPDYYGIRYRAVGMPREGDAISLVDADKIYFAISATNLQSTYYADKESFGWLKKEIPVYVAGRSIFVYEITQNPERLREFAAVLRRSGAAAEAEALYARVLH